MKLNSYFHQGQWPATCSSPKLCLWLARVYKTKFNLGSLKRMKDNFYQYMENSVHTVKFSKHCLCCYRICEILRGKMMLETLQWKERKNTESKGSPISLLFHFKVSHTTDYKKHNPVATLIPCMSLKKQWKRNRENFLLPFFCSSKTMQIININLQSTVILCFTKILIT
jgi:hypothetical protein